MYAPLAPIVVICGTIYFWAASIVVRCLEMRCGLFLQLTILLDVQPAHVRRGHERDRWPTVVTSRSTLLPPTVADISTSHWTENEIYWDEHGRIRARIHDNRYEIICEPVKSLLEPYWPTER